MFGLLQAVDRALTNNNNNNYNNKNNNDNNNSLITISKEKEMAVLQYSLEFSKFDFVIGHLLFITKNYPIEKNPSSPQP